MLFIRWTREFITSMCIIAMKIWFLWAGLTALVPSELDCFFLCRKSNTEIYNWGKANNICLFSYFTQTRRSEFHSLGLLGSFSKIAKTEGVLGFYR